MRALRLAGAFALLATAGCKKHVVPPSEELVVPDACDGMQSGIVCEHGVALTCANGDVARTDDCAAQQLTCSSVRGCEVCRASYYSCQGNELYVCNQDGTELSFVEECSGDLKCSENGCADLCGIAEKERSYVGCEYWPVFTLNSQLDPVFRPAVVVGNPNLVEAHVTLRKGDQLIAEATVAPGSAETLNVQLDPTDALRTKPQTQLVRKGAYRLVSDVPVIAHQFNPLEFEVSEACLARRSPDPNDPPEKPCHSYTNDASLLLPAHVLSRPSDGGVSYLGISRASFLSGVSIPAPDGGAPEELWSGLSGFLTLVAVGAEPVHVTIRSSAYTLGSEPEDGADAGTLGDAGLSDAGSPLDPGMDAGQLAQDAGIASPTPAKGTVPPLAPGDTYSVVLRRGDVLQLLTRVPTRCDGTSAPTGRTTLQGPEIACDLGAPYDLTGSAIEADGPLQVIGGHDCTYVPFDRTACDHLEESLFPVETWGKRVIVGKPRETDEALYRLRVISGADGNEVKFSPAISEPIKLQRGEWRELEADQNLLVSGTKPLAVAQYFVGQSAIALNGDPSLSLAPPVEQYRASYTFLSPESYTTNYVTIIAPKGETVVLDGDTVLGFEPVGKTGYSITTVLLTASGDHEIHSEHRLPFGISLYGFGAYTSYMLPGGLDLNVISDVE